MPNYVVSYDNAFFTGSTTTSSLTYQIPTSYWYGNQVVAYKPDPNTELAARQIKPEEPLEWLKRRVDEIAWSPA